MSKRRKTLPLERLGRNLDGERAHAGQAVRFLNFRMRIFYGYRSSVFRETKLFKAFVSLGQSIRGFRSEASSPDRLSRVAAEAASC